MQLNNPDFEDRIFAQRMILAIVIIAILSLILLARIFNLQILQYNYYTQESLDNQLVFLPITPTRGRIFDKNGVVIADNELTYQLTITPEKVQDMQETLEELKKNHIISDPEIDKFYQNRPHYKRFQDIVLVKNLSEEKMAYILGSQSYSGLNITPNFKRIYPTKEVFSHVLGFIGRINKQEQEKYKNISYQGIDQVGKIGIEKQYEFILHGVPGYKNVIRNASGRSLSEKIVKNIQPGADLYLTVDYDLQKKALELLGNRKGAIVMLMVKTGEVLVLASAPSFDANSFVDGISTKDYQALQNDPDKPLFNRAIKGTYPPGSTIKPFIALAAIESGIVPEDHEIFCRGWYSLPNHTHPYRDWKKSGHGKVGLTQSIAQSCDVFFYDIAYKIGIDVIHNHLEKFNFGRKTGIDLIGESSGVLPSKAWKRHYRGQPWYRGETIIVGIGQGFMTTTPLQLVLSIAALANHGQIIQPRILSYSRAYNGKIKQNSAITHDFAIADIKHYEKVIEGMKQAVYGKRGTARRLNKNLNYTLAGKTGTAQVFGLARDESYVEQNIAEHLRDHALFTAFAPITEPEVAIAVIVENAGSGSAHAAPLAKKMLDLYFQKKDNKAPVLKTRLD